VITDPVAVLVVLAAVVFTAVQLERRYRPFRSLSAALVGILLGMLLSNLGIIPGESPTYQFLVGPGVSVGIVLILLSVDLRTVISAGPRMLGGFGIGAAGTAVGAVVGGLTWSGLVGPESWKLSGQFAGTYTGGGVNFAALGEAFDTSSDLFTAGIAADVIITALWMAVCLSAPVALSWLGGGDRAPAASPATSPAPAEESAQFDHSIERTLYASRRPVQLADVAAMVVIGIGTVWASGRLGELVPQLPEVLWLTTIALLLAQVPAVRGLAGSAVVGNYLVLLFLASNGARSVVAKIFEVGPGVFYFAATVVAIHGLVIFGLGRLARLELGELAVASQACIGGPASAMALASARGYTARILPGVAVGLLGYALGNYWGYLIGRMMQGVLGG